MIPQKLIDKGKYWTKACSLVEGCTPVSEACDNCWLQSQAHRFKQCICNENGISKPLTDAYSGKWTGHISIREDRLNIPLKTRKPQVFAVWSDLFHEAVPDGFIARALTIMERCYHAGKEQHKHTFLILTKRIERMQDFFKNFATKTVSPIQVTPNIFIGTTAENQEQADKRIPELLKIPGNKFLSVEPMLGPINLFNSVNAIFGTLRHPPYVSNISQVICGGETGRNARPCNPDWVRRLRDQCAEAGVPFFFKGFGGKKKGRILDGRTHDELAWNEY